MTMKNSSQSTRAAFRTGERDAAQESAAIEADLECPKKLITDAAGRLLGSFIEFASLEPKTSRNHAEGWRIAMTIGSAVTALHFQDMGEQLYAHARRRLAAGENRLRSLHGETPDGRLPLRLQHSQPVQRAEISTGSADPFFRSDSQSCFGKAMTHTLDSRG